ncbi:MAG: bL35 family ribosomal protein [Candidatus Shapirobacteria bacterium]|jgi:ribosomal protein L35
MKNKPKFKILKSVSSRFEVTRNGKVLRKSSFLNHLRSHKSQKQLRRLRGKKAVLGRFAIKVKKLLGKA